MSDKNTQIKTTVAGFGKKIWQHLGIYLLIGLVAAVVSLMFFLWLADEVFEGDTKIFDETVRQTIHQAAVPWLTQVMIFMSFIGSVAFIVGVLIFVTIIFLRLKWKHAAALLLITMAGEVVLDLTLKLFFQRARPEAFFNYPLPASYSFPSGHALGSFCFYIALAWLITSRIKNRGLKILIWIFAPTLVLLIGVSRIYLGVHFPSDVLAGFTAAFVWVFTIAFGDFLLRKRNSENF